MRKVTENERFLHFKRSKRAYALKGRQDKKHYFKNEMQKEKEKSRSRYRSPILNEFSYFHNRVGISRNSKKVEIPIPKVFSIIDTPKQSLKQIYIFISKLLRAGKVEHIRIDHQKLTNFDLAAESIFDLLTTEFMKESDSQNKKISISGVYPDSDKLKRFIKSMGIVSKLNVKQEIMSNESEPDLRIFDERCKSSSIVDSTNSSDHKENTVRKFVDHINECLSTNGRRLTNEAVDELGDYTGELLTNAEDHSGRQEWFIAGYLDNATDNKICEITIYNFGDSIAKTFKNLSGDDYTFSIINPYIEKHAKSGFFDKQWKEDDLLTLVALQGDISTKNVDELGDRGQGTVDMINFFQQVQKECSNNLGSIAKMAVLSGNTHILFDGKYDMQVDRNDRSIIAFNKSNSLNEKPDSNCIQNLGKVYFPGTIISFRFSVKNLDLEEI